MSSKLITARKGYKKPIRDRSTYINKGILDGISTTNGNLFLYGGPSDDVYYNSAKTTGLGKNNNGTTTGISTGYNLGDLFSGIGSIFNGGSGGSNESAGTDATKKGMSKGTKLAIAGGITTAGSLIGNAFKSGNNHDNTGKKLGMAGTALQTAGTLSGNVWLTAAGTAAKLADDLFFTYGVENEGAMRDNTARLRNTNFTGKNNSDLIEQYKNARLYTVGPGKISNGWGTDEGDELARSLGKEQALAYNQAFGNFKNAANNAAKNLYADQMYYYSNDYPNFTAFGGQLDIKDKDAIITDDYMNILNNKFATGGEKGSKVGPTARKVLRGWKENVVDPVVEGVSSLFPSSTPNYGGGLFTGAGAGGTWGAPDWYETIPADTMWVPVQGRTFNDAFAEARAKGLKVFDFNGKTYTTEMSNNPGWKEAGDNRRAEALIPIIRKERTIHHTGNKRPLGGYYETVDPSTAIGYLFYTDRYIKDNNKNYSSMTNLFAGTPGSMFAEGGPKENKLENNLGLELEDLLYYLKQRAKYPYGRKYSDAERFLIDRLGVPERYTEPIFNSKSIAPDFIVNPTPEERVNAAFKAGQKVVKSIGNQTRKTVSKGEPYVPHVKFALGGTTNTNGASFSTGLTHVNTGGSHEENPNDGVQVGVDSLNVPNLVEEGEVIYDDYVFSNRLTIPNYKKEYNKKKEAPYEALVLWNYSDLSFADAAKKIEKNTGASERPEDNVSQRGMESDLQVLAQVQEKEREKEKLKEIQEAIDNMTPEEFAALQQQMQAMQLQAQQEEIAQQEQLALLEAMQQQQPSEEELAAMQQLQMAALEMLLAAAPQQMMAANGGAIDTADNNTFGDGGILNTPDNMYPYGGDFAKFTQELADRGLTVDDYLRYLLSQGKIDLDTMDFYTVSDNNRDLFSDSFDKDLAELYLKNLETKEKQVARLYRKNNKDPKKLTGAGLLKYKEDVLKASRNPSLLENDADKELFVNQVGKGDTKSFNIAATDAVTKETRQAYFGSPMSALENGKFAIDYGRPEGVADDWLPRSADLIKNPITISEGRFVDSKGNEIANPFEGDYGFTSPSRDWKKYGYVNPKDNSWTGVEYNPPTDASGNTDYKYAPWNDWFKQSGMDADKYEALDAYLNNYLDFLDDIYNEESPNHLAALRRLYEMGEATKSNAPGELKGKNRYFDTDKEGFDADNLSLNNLRVVDGYNTIGDSKISGFSIYNDVASNKAGINNKQYYINKNGRVISPTTFLGLDEKEKKDYTPLDHKGLTRQDVLNSLKATRNKPLDTDPNDLLFHSMFDNVPAQSYLMAPKASNRYALVDNTGKYILDANNQVQYLNPDVADNPLYSIYNEGNPIVTDTLGDTTVNTIGVLGGNYSPHIAVVDGKYYNLSPELAALFAKYKVTDPNKISSYTGFDTPITGYSVNPTYYEIPEEGMAEAGLGTLSKNTVREKDPFPKAPTWPFLAGLGLLLGSLGYNILSPKDYSNADAMIKAALNAGKYTPVSFNPIGNYQKYTPDDPWFYTSPVMALSNATKRMINNRISPSNDAASIANTYNTMVALGLGTRQLLDNNFNKYAKVGEYNKDTDKFNSEGFLKADMANLDAATRARGFNLEGLKSGYAMKQAIDDAKANAINAGISGIGNLLYSYAGNKYNQDVLGWGIRHNAYAPQDVRAKKGGKLKRKKKGLSF